MSQKKLARPLKRFGPRMVLLVGFGAVLILMSFISIDSLRSFDKFETSNAQIRQDFRYRAQTIDRVRASLYQAAIHIGAEIGVLLLLFMLGLEYMGEELRRNLCRGYASSIVDFALNFPPGLIAGFLLGWKPLAAVLLGGITYISSSGVIVKVLIELRRLEYPEMPGSQPSLRTSRSAIRGYRRFHFSM